MSKEAPGRLLLVEDEPVLRGLVQQFLDLEGYDVEPAADGQEAIDAYEARGPFDLILMDLNMPRICGVEACRRIRGLNPRQPILVCSAAILESHVEALRALGLRDALTKPYHPVELAATVRRLLGEADAPPVHGGAAWRDHGGHPDAGRGSAIGRRPSALSDLRGLG